MGVVPEDLRQLSRDPVDAAGIGPNMKPDDILCDLILNAGR